MSISFAITTHNEGKSIDLLLYQLLNVMDVDDEIVILDDYSDDEKTVEILSYWKRSFPKKLKFEQRSLQNNFGEHKNYLNSLCSSEWIFQLDADEYLGKMLSAQLHTLLTYNEEVDLFYVPRVNIVKGITKEDIRKYGWIQNENDWIMWPDFQTRIYKNDDSIYWSGHVHERIVGFDSYAALPEEEGWAIHHIKTITKQREQNAFYNELSG